MKTLSKEELSRFAPTVQNRIRRCLKLGFKIMNITGSKDAYFDNTVIELSYEIGSGKFIQQCNSNSWNNDRSVSGWNSHPYFLTIEGIEVNMPGFRDLENIMKNLKQKNGVQV